VHRFRGSCVGTGPPIQCTAKLRRVVDLEANCGQNGPFSSLRDTGSYRAGEVIKMASEKRPRSSEQVRTSLEQPEPSPAAETSADHIVVGASLDLPPEVLLTFGLSYHISLSNAWQFHWKTKYDHRLQLLFRFLERNGRSLFCQADLAKRLRSAAGAHPKWTKNQIIRAVDKGYVKLSTVDQLPLKPAC
jgi:hypothetical protein